MTTKMETFTFTLTFKMTATDVESWCDEHDKSDSFKRNLLEFLRKQGAADREGMDATWDCVECCPNSDEVLGEIAENADASGELDDQVCV